MKNLGKIVKTIFLAGALGLSSVHPAVSEGPQFYSLDATQSNNAYYYVTGKKNIDIPKEMDVKIDFDMSSMKADDVKADYVSNKGNRIYTVYKRPAPKKGDPEGKSEPQNPKLSLVDKVYPNNPMIPKYVGLKFDRFSGLSDFNWFWWISPGDEYFNFMLTYKEDDLDVTAHFYVQGQSWLKINGKSESFFRAYLDKYKIGNGDWVYWNPEKKAS